MGEGEADKSKLKGKVTNDERNLVVSFIQFLRQKVSSNECTEDQIEGLEGIYFKFNLNNIFIYYSN